MALAIRLARGGAKKRPFYRIVVADSRSPRDGRVIERLGFYNPMAAPDNPERYKLHEERIQYGLSQGARPSDRVARMLAKSGVIAARPVPHQTKKSKPKARAIERQKEEAERQAQLEKEREEARKLQEEKETQKAEEAAQQAAAEGQPEESGEAEAPAEAASEEATEASPEAGAEEATEEEKKE